MVNVAALRDVVVSVAYLLVVVTSVTGVRGVEDSVTCFLGVVVSVAGLRSWWLTSLASVV